MSESTTSTEKRVPPIPAIPAIPAIPSIPSIKDTRAQGAMMTGARYLESLRDDREAWYRGERVKDVTTHPELREMARSLARIYDMQHEPETRDIMTYEQENGLTPYTIRAWTNHFARPRIRTVACES